MARGVNKVILVGNVGNDPDVRFTPAGSAVANLTIATSEKWMDKQSGQPREKTEWHRIVIFGKTAEIVQQYVRKGSKLYIEGKLQTRKWQDNSGQDRYTTEIVVDGFNGQMQILDSPDNSGAQNTHNAPQNPSMPSHAPQQRPANHPAQQPQPNQQARNSGQPVQPQGYDDFDQNISF